MPTDPPSPTRADLARELLRYKMQESSQDGFCASWLVDLEWELWTEADQSESAPEREHIRSTSRECRVLAEIAGGWWAWDNEMAAKNNPVFVPMQRWLEIVEARNSS